MSNPITHTEALELLSPSSRARAFNRLLDFARTTGDRFSKWELALFEVELTNLARSQHRQPVFRHVCTDGQHDHFEIGYQGEPLRTVKTSLRGVWATWWVLDDEGKSDTLRAADLAAPDADEPEQSVRRMIHTTAAKQFARWAMPELEAAAKACKVTNGIVRCERPVHAPKVTTR
jgi:hypothetical protein